MPPRRKESYFYYTMAEVRGTADSSAVRFALSDLPAPLVYAEHRIIRDCNDAFAELFGGQRADIVQLSFSRLYPQIDDFIRRGEQWATNFADSASYRDERVMSGLDGRRFWCRVRGRSLARRTDPFAKAIYWFEYIPRTVLPAGRSLSERQRQILSQVAQGKTSGAIALEMGLSRRTVEAHRMRLMRSVGARNTAELMTWFLEHDAGPSGVASGRAS